jgi:hypothetical protein
MERRGISKTSTTFEEFDLLYPPPKSAYRLLMMLMQANNEVERELQCSNFYSMCCKYPLDPKLLLK